MADRTGVNPTIYPYPLTHYEFARIRRIEPCTEERWMVVQNDDDTLSHVRVDAWGWTEAFVLHENGMPGSPQVAFGPLAIINGEWMAMFGSDDMSPYRPVIHYTEESAIAAIADYYEKAGRA